MQLSQIDNEQQVTTDDPDSPQAPYCWIYCDGYLYW